ncbi:MAG: hypothetical protein EBR82_08105 [Caulobacteraceae bacterium]|nr:hypothetical protein [Caulobacteraceae bacterium]
MRHVIFALALAGGLCCIAGLLAAIGGGDWLVPLASGLALEALALALVAHAARAPGFRESPAQPSATMTLPEIESVMAENGGFAADLRRQADDAERLALENPDQADAIRADAARFRAIADSVDPPPAAGSAS